MSLVRHVAGIPTATEQRCIRCCEVITTIGLATFVGAFKRGSEVVCNEQNLPFLNQDREFFADDCTPHDPHAEGGHKGVTLDSLGDGIASAVVDNTADFEEYELDMRVPEHLR